jgi:hypothetical protein
MTQPNHDRLERLLDDLATPLSKYHTARATLAHLQLTGNSGTMRRWSGAISSASAELEHIEQLIKNYTFGVDEDEQVDPTRPTDVLT